MLHIRRFAHRETLDDAARRFARSGDVAGAAYATVANLAQIRGKGARARAALFFVCAGMRSHAQALLASSDPSDPVAAFVRAAVDVFADEWPEALHRLVARAAALEDDALIAGCAQIFCARCELLGTNPSSAIERLKRVRLRLDSDAPGLAYRAALVEVHAFQELGDDLAARKLLSRYAGARGTPATVLLERAVDLRFGEPSHLATDECTMRFDDAFVYAAAAFGPMSRHDSGVARLASLLDAHLYEPILAPEFAVAVASLEAQAGARAFLTRIERTAKHTTNPTIEHYAALARLRHDAVRGDRLAASPRCASIAREFRTLGFARAAGLALDTMILRDGTSQRSGPRDPRALTRRQEEVAALLRTGATNREIAIKLSISGHTVERHVSAILIRLDLRSRWQLLDAGDRFSQETLRQD